MKQIQWCSGVVVMSVQRERSQRMDVLTTLLIGLMALFGEVPQPEVDRVCEEREVALERALEGWEREIIKAHLANDRLKAATPEERLSIPDYKKVIYFRLGSLSSKLDLSLKKVSTDAGVRLRNLKRRAGFDANILPAKKPAQSDANRKAKVNNIEIVLTQGDWFAVYGKNKLFSGSTTRR